MSDFEKCKICGEYDFLSKHKCPPIYYFKHESWGDEFQEVRAWTFDGAAEKFARMFNENGDYNLMDCEEEVIISDGETEKRFVVSAEQDISYSVTEVE